MSMNPFGKMQKAAPEEVKVNDTDSLGGAKLSDTGVYDAEIKMMYSILSKGGAAGVVVEFDLGDKQTFTMTEYVSSGDDKGNVNYYIDKQTGDKMLLPGYQKMDGLCLLATKQTMEEQTWEEKLVPIWNFDAKADVNTKVPVATSMIGGKVKIAILRIKENKTIKNDATGKYDIKTNEVREFNELSKVFHAESGKTMQEYRDKKEAADFINKWAEKYGNKTVDKYKHIPGAPTAGSPGQAAAGAGGNTKPTASLF